MDACYTKYKDDPTWNKPIALGVQRWVVLAGLIGGVGRAVLECPFEYTKVRRQTGASWSLKHVYTGIEVCLCRNIGLLVIFFSLLDAVRRKTKFFETKLG